MTPAMYVGNYSLISQLQMMLSPQLPGWIANSDARRKPGPEEPKLLKRPRHGS